MKIFGPTGKCFDDALDLLSDIIRAHPDVAHSNEMKLIHGVCLAPDGTHYAHAWLEREGIEALFVAMVDGVRRTLKASVIEYREHFRVVKVIAYTPRQAAEENYRSGHFGPWTEELRALCQKAGEPMKVWQIKGADESHD